MIWTKIHNSIPTHISLFKMINSNNINNIESTYYSDIWGGNYKSTKSSQISNF